MPFQNTRDILATDWAPWAERGRQWTSKNWRSGHLSEKVEATRSKGNTLGLNCITETELCAMMIARAEKNQNLKEAFLIAKRVGVQVMPRDPSRFKSGAAGKIGEGYVIINPRASDEKIIEFLTK